MLGGYAPNYSDALGRKGDWKIKEFLQAGGGFLGICAGAYYACWAELIDCYVFNIQEWQRGHTDYCKISFTRDGTQLVPAAFTSQKKHMHLVYVNGPML